jgi:hypothetical protein
VKQRTDPLTSETIPKSNEMISTEATARNVLFDSSSPIQGHQPDVSVRAAMITECKLSRSLMAWTARHDVPAIHRLRALSIARAGFPSASLGPSLNALTTPEAAT